jgi:hypothetical protein
MLMGELRSWTLRDTVMTKLLTAVVDGPRKQEQKERP